MLPHRERERRRGLRRPWTDWAALAATAVFAVEAAHVVWLAAGSEGPGAAPQPVEGLQDAWWLGDGPWAARECPPAGGEASLAGDDDPLMPKWPREPPPGREYYVGQRVRMFAGDVWCAAAVAALQPDGRMLVHYSGWPMSATAAVSESDSAAVQPARGGEPECQALRGSQLGLSPLTHPLAECSAAIADYCTAFAGRVDCASADGFAAAQERVARVNPDCPPPAVLPWAPDAVSFPLCNDAMAERGVAEPAAVGAPRCPTFGRWLPRRGAHRECSAAMHKMGVSAAWTSPQALQAWDAAQAANARACPRPALGRWMPDALWFPECSGAIEWYCNEALMLSVCLDWRSPAGRGLYWQYQEDAWRDGKCPSPKAYRWAPSAQSG